MIAARLKQPAVLIVNPSAGRLTQAVHDDVVAAVRARFDVEAFSTTARDTGITLAYDAAEASAPLVIAFGGDGHINEVANGLAGTNTPLGVVPGGTMNVFARALGISLNPFQAIERLFSLVPELSPRSVSLGLMNERYFTFAAGCGFDAEAADRVGRYVPTKRVFGEGFYYWSAFRVLAGSLLQRSPTMTIRGSFGEEAVALAIACNAGPYAYLFGRPVRLAPRVELDKGIDLFALRSLRLESLPNYALRTALVGDLSGHPDAIYEHDLDSFEVLGDGPFARHVDGEPLSPGDSVKFSIARSILKVYS